MATCLLSWGVKFGFRVTRHLVSILVRLGLKLQVLRVLASNTVQLLLFAWIQPPAMMEHAVVGLSGVYVLFRWIRMLSTWSFIGVVGLRAHPSLVIRVKWLVLLRHRSVLPLRVVTSAVLAA